MATISKPTTFSAGNTIIASEHNSNFDTIYNDYNGNITNINVASGAAIAASKLNLATIAQNITFTGDNTFAGTTIADLGSVTTADINGGTVDATVGGTTPAAGTFTALQANTTLKLGTTNQGDIIYDNGTSLVRLTPGTSGNFLKTQGAAANPIWDSAGGTNLISTTTGSDTNTGDITIAASKQYLVTFDLEANSVSSSTIGLRFNSSSTASGYAWGGKSITFNTTSVETTDGDDSDAQIYLMFETGSGGYTDDMLATSGYCKGQLFIDTNKVGTAISAFVNGTFIFLNEQSQIGHATFGGVNQENLTVTSFELFFSQSVNFTVKTYELD